MSLEQTNIWNHNQRAALTHNERYFSATSELDVYDVVGGKATYLPSLKDAEVKEWMSAGESLPTESSSSAVPSTAPPRSSPANYRIVFIKSVEGDTDKLFVTTSLLQELLDKYAVSPRFASFITRQHSPSRSLSYDASQDVCRHQFWYSAILRTAAVHIKSDLSKRVMGWSRVCVWAGHDLRDGTTTILAMRVPRELQHNMMTDFEGTHAMPLQRHPMSVHAIIMQDIVIRTYDFLEVMSEPVYIWENHTDVSNGHLAYSRRSQAFLELTRQITQVATDYEILTTSLKRIQEEHDWMEKNWTKPIEARDAAHWNQDHIFAGEMFRFYLEDTKLCHMYDKLYEERTKIGISEGFAMLSQKDAELNIQMARESTQVARDTRADGQSLRSLQILGSVFLPASFVSGIFGMGFFSSSPDDNGKLQFNASNKWWYFLVFAIPLTLVTFAAIAVSNTYQKWQSSRAERIAKAGMNDEKRIPSISYS